MKSLFTIAHQQSEEAADFGFDWHNSQDVMNKIFEEIHELQEGVHQRNRHNIEHEMGDVLLALTSLARHCDISLEHAFSKAIQRFQNRWEMMQKLTTTPVESLSSAELEILWEQAKEELQNQEDQ